jgi:hypothetical protein
MLGSSTTIVISALGVVVWHAVPFPGVSAQSCDTYVVSSIPGGFTQKTYIDFSSVSPDSNAAPLLS